MNGLVRMEVDDLFTPIQSTIVGGHCQLVLQKKAQKAIRANLFTQRTICNWNNLPSEVISSPSVNVFKKRLDEAWKEKIYKSSVA